MGFVLTAEKAGWHLWIFPMMLAIPTSLILSVLSLPEPRAGQVAGVVNVSTSGAAGFLDLLQLDPDLRLVDQRWNGHVIFVVSQKTNFAQLARQTGALVVFDAKAVGCNFPAPNGENP